MLEFTFIEEDDALQVWLKGDLDIEGTEVVDEQLLPKITSYSKVNIDFKEVPFVDSSGMGLLINMVDEIKNTGNTVTISNVRDEVYEVFELLQLSEIIGEEVFV
ncbi:anti-sigma B factor antagonist/stage II sporulation protein AA (anti-sigma F factor antagonist) [Alkalibacillus filiformis]|uniref:Anti-sigma factor antagonist n=1 Tax=Alkalibacillus filiformis TaxID=200990 RepID=A0ABU0DVM9_9BACI|nr:STAS domain-containing protein [Alkalibacillus filiformis]MDQ0352523.1 anti-sigma B factor antagonist/stage II sporulation protein AA (anti-sigma F factor antagonist) [Alkalibacillus filiformis]